MAQITTKELSALGDGLMQEKNMIAKYQFYASCETDSTLKNKYQEIAQAHQRHYDELYSQLK